MIKKYFVRRICRTKIRGTSSKVLRTYDYFISQSTLALLGMETLYETYDESEAYKELHRLKALDKLDI